MGDSRGHHTPTNSMKSFIVACLVALVSAEANPEAYTNIQAHALGLGVHAVNPYTNTPVAYNNAAFAPVTYNNAAFAPVTYTNAAVSPVNYAKAVAPAFPYAQTTSTYAAGIHAPTFNYAHPTYTHGLPYY